MKEKKEYWYLLFDLDTKNKKFNTYHYVQIKKFMISHGFNWMKDSNYLTKEKMFTEDIISLTNEFIAKFPQIASECTKFDWATFNPKKINHLSQYVVDAGKRILRERQHDNDFEHGRGGKDF